MSEKQVSSGWLGASSTFTRSQERRRGPAFMASLMLHGLGVLAVFAFMAWAPKSLVQVIPQEKADLVFVQAAGPGGGGGGGNKMPDPPRKLEMKAELPKAPVIEPVTVTPEVPPPSLMAPIQTNMAVLQMAGAVTGLGAAPSTGPGTGTGSGPGKGSGIGPGDNGGYGGGPMREGSGAAPPTLLKSVDPKYTTEAMRARIQGIVTLEVEVGADGLVKNVKILKSLDRATGLDDQAIKTAREWRFRPATYQGKPVPYLVIIEMTFNLR